MIEDRLKKAFDSIHADDDLVSRTVANVSARLTEEPPAQPRQRLKRLAPLVILGIVAAVVVGALVLWPREPLPRDEVVTYPVPVTVSPTTAPSTALPFDRTVAYRLYLEINPAIELQLNVDTMVVDAT
jgi:hypothetical protein